MFISMSVECGCYLDIVVKVLCFVQVRISQVLLMSGRAFFMVLLTMFLERYEFVAYDHIMYH
jgi:hypothetical protein